jgi:hypothetical protein
MKEVQMNTSSFVLKSINTRGFATVANNTLLMQLVDGMDNASPLLNFVLGNLIEFQRLMFKAWSLAQGHLRFIWCQCVGILLFMTSQSPFTSQGITACAFGQTSQKLLGQTTMLIMELEWRMRLVQTCRKSLTLPICAVQIGMLQTTTTKRTLVRQKSCEL